MSEIRENRLTGEWVIIAAERAKRGGNLASATERVVVPPFLASCMFCPGNEAMAAEERFRFDGEDGRWVLRSVVNKFSVLSSTGEVARTGCGVPGEVSVNGVGLHEVLIESPRHDVTMALCPVAHVHHHESGKNLHHHGRGGAGHHSADLDDSHRTGLGFLVFVQLLAEIFRRRDVSR